VQGVGSWVEVEGRHRYSRRGGQWCVSVRKLECGVCMLGWRATWQVPPLTWPIVAGTWRLRIQAAWGRHGDAECHVPCITQQFDEQ
jgi:hypothetical protein